jgi:hypothetical protein
VGGICQGQSFPVTRDSLTGIWKGTTTFGICSLLWQFWCQQSGTPPQQWWEWQLSVTSDQEFTYSQVSGSCSPFSIGFLAGDTARWVEKGQYCCGDQMSLAITVTT